MSLLSRIFALALTALLYLVALSYLAATPAFAGSVLDRVRQDGLVRCGAPIRPGLAFPAPGGAWHGLEVELCRAVAVAVLGAPGRIVFTGYAPLTRSYDRVRNGEDDISFLTAADILRENALAAVLPGPTVFYSTASVLVMAASPAHHLGEIGDSPICAEPGTGPERSLVGWFEAHHLPLRYFMFQEADEMLDAFYAGRCDAISNETVNLAAIRLEAAQRGHETRLLPDTLSTAPILAASPVNDGQWAALVTWTVDTVIRAQPAGGHAALPLAGKPLGLAEDWQNAVLDQTDSYAAIYDRNLGAGSPLALPAGPNSLWTEGGLLCPPITE